MVYKHFHWKNAYVLWIAISNNNKRILTFYDCKVIFFWSFLSSLQIHSFLQLPFCRILVYCVVSLLPCPCHCVVLLSYVPSCGCLSTGYVCSTPFIVFAFIFILFTILQRDPQNTSSAFQWVPPFFVVHDISTISFYIVLSNIRSWLLLWDLFVITALLSFT